MPLSFTRYVDITSGVGAGIAVQERELILRIFTTNNLLPVGSYTEFSNIEQVGAYFGTSTEEYTRAQFYFSWISKNITSPDKISFGRWVQTAVAPMIFGAPLTATLSQFQAITNGAINLTLGGITHNVAGIDFSEDLSFTAMAATLQVAIRAADVSGQWAASLVTYDSTPGSFNFVGGAPGDFNISIAAGSPGTDITTLLGWTTGAIISNGSTIETITDTLAQSAAASDNFGSFLFIPTLTSDEILEAAQWNDSQNFKFMYLVPVTISNYAATSAAIMTYAGCGITLAPISTEFPEQLPANILAATDYQRANSTQNYMFQMASLTPSVSDDTVADALDVARVNYYGVTQSAGQFLSFYQQGYLTGGANDAVDMNVYANEQWLKSAAGAVLMQLLLAKAKISANIQGRSEVMAVLQSIIDQAITNNTISVGKTLSEVQKLYVSQITNDELAWMQVQNAGYWVNAVVTSYVESSITKYKIVYTLVYSKDDVVRKIEGTHVLI